jgi:hypothetical protein
MGSTFKIQSIHYCTVPSHATYSSGHYPLVRSAIGIGTQHNTSAPKISIDVSSYLFDVDVDVDVVAVVSSFERPLLINARNGFELFSVLRSEVGFDLD